MAELNSLTPQPMSHWSAQRQSELEQRKKRLRQRCQQLGQRLQLDGFSTPERDNPGITEQLQALLAAEQKMHRQLATKVSQLAQASQSNSDFIATASHELRTPLTGMLSSLELIDTYLQRSKGLDDWSYTRIATHLERSRRAVGQFKTLVDDLLVLEKAAAGYQVSEPEITDLDSWLADLLDAFQPVAERQSITLSLQQTISRPVHLDQKLVRHCLNNLISNALNFCPAGASVLVSARLRDQHLLLSVSDTGPGIAQADQARIFDAFYRGHNAELAAGSGLGLAIVQRFISLLDGQIELRSRVGRGTRFTLTLPLASEETTHGRTDSHH